MLTVHLGPLPVPIALLLPVLALLVAVGAARLVGPGPPTGIGNVLVDTHLGELSAASLASKLGKFRLHTNPLTNE